MSHIFIFTLLGISLVINLMFITDYYTRKIEERAAYIQSQEQKEYFTETIFGEDFKLRDYSSVKFDLEEEGRNIIQNAREFHSSPAIIKGEAYNEAVCAGFVFALSEILWDKTAPYLIGMMEQNTKTPADAWQMPYSFEYVGGQILADFSLDFSLQDLDYWEKIESKKLQDFFFSAFSEEALLGEIGFLYADTAYLFDLDMYENYNSHIAKNVGISSFQKSLVQVEGKSHAELVRDAFGSTDQIFLKAKSLLPHYSFELRGQRVVWHEEAFYFLLDDNEIGEKVVFQDYDTLHYNDVTLMHFFHGAQVDGLLEMTLAGKFFPINILQINPRLIEKI